MEGDIQVKKFGGYLLVATGFVACPCHLAFTLPLALALLGGTAVGSFLAENTALVVGLSVGYFIGALWLGFSLIKARAGTSAEECPACLPDVDEVQKPATRANPAAALGAGKREPSNR